MSFTYTKSSLACPICDDKSGDCRVNELDVWFCIRNHGTPYTGYAYLGEASSAGIGRGVWGMYQQEDKLNRRLDGERVRFNPSAPFSMPVDFDDFPRPRPEKPSPERLKELRERWVLKMTYRLPKGHKRRRELAEELSLPYSFVDDVPFRWCPNDGTRRQAPCWVFFEFLRPNTDFTSYVFRHRKEDSPDGKIPKIAHGPRGLTVFPGWDKGGPLVFCEGASDVITLRGMGLTALGRPNNLVGGKMLDEYLTAVGWDPERPIIVLGEWDCKFNDNGSIREWPGRDGIERVAGELIQSGKWKVIAALPPDRETKDVRQWFVKNRRGDYHAMGQQFLETLSPWKLRGNQPRPPLSPPPSHCCESHGSDGANLSDTSTVKPDLSFLYKDLNEQIHHVGEAIAERCFKFGDCIQPRKVLVENRTTGTPGVRWFRCENRSCPACRDYKNYCETMNATVRFGNADQLYRLELGQESWDTVRRRIRRAGGEFIFITVNGVRVAYSDVETPGAHEATPEQCLCEFKRLLSEHEGDKRPVSTSQAWKLIPPQYKGNLRVIGKAADWLTPDLVREIAESLDAEIHEHLPIDNRKCMRQIDIHKSTWTASAKEHLYYCLMAGEVIPMFEIITEPPEVELLPVRRRLEEWLALGQEE